MDFYNGGMSYGKWQEERIVLSLSLEVADLLRLTMSDDGWEKFLDLLEDVSGHRNHKRLRIEPVLTRKDGYPDRKGEKLTEGTANDDFRLYDFPENPKDPHSPIQPGRMSVINSLTPDLLVSIHMTPAGRGHEGGMASVLTPGYRTFDLIRKIHLDKKPYSEFTASPWFTETLWLVTEPGWSVYQSARSDTWVYFHGYRSRKDGSGPWKSYNRGFKYNLVTWKYADAPGWEQGARENRPGPYSQDYKNFRPEGKFWDRERGEPESWRREEDTGAGFGGDNHLASDEILRFIQYRFRHPGPSLSTKKTKLPTPGPIQKPYVSAYSLPVYVNAITAYLEVGYLNRSKDRSVVMKYKNRTAGAIAAGIYSLFAGMKGLDQKVRFAPRGKAIDFSRYRKYKTGNYFENVLP